MESIKSLWSVNTTIQTGVLFFESYEEAYSFITQKHNINSKYIDDIVWIERYDYYGDIEDKKDIIRIRRQTSIFQEEYSKETAYHIKPENKRKSNYLHHSVGNIYQTFQKVGVEFSAPIDDYTQYEEIFENIFEEKKHTKILK